MKSVLIRIFSLAAALLAVFLSVPSAGAITYTNDIETKSESVLLVNMDTGQTVYEKEADAKRYPASTTKIMTYIIAVENIDDLDNTMIPIKQSVLDVLDGTGSSVANVEAHVGESMSAIDLLYSMMVPSGNDAAVVIADYVGDGNGEGGIEAFVGLMNEKAEELGCENTHFVNPDGLHDDDHYTTARELYTITSYALTLPRFSEITNTTEYYCDGDSYPLVTTNYLIDLWRGGEYYYTYAKGIKTGTTDEAGRCLVTTASADGYSYMVILLKAPYEEGVYEEYDTFTDAANLFRWALTKLELDTVISAKTPVCEEKINLAWGVDSVLLVPETNLNAILPENYDKSYISTEIDVPESVDAPVTTDTVIGTATVYYQDDTMEEKQELAAVNLVSSENIDRSGFLYVVRIIWEIIQSYWFSIIVGAIILILIIYFIVSKINRRRNRGRRKVKNYRNL